MLTDPTMREMIASTVDLTGRVISEMFVRLGYAYAAIGAIAFGLLVGWLCHLVVIRSDRVSIPWFSSLVAIIGGGTTLMAVLRESYLFASYSFGLVLGYGAHGMFTAVASLTAPYLGLLKEMRNMHVQAMRDELSAGPDAPTPVLDVTTEVLTRGVIALAISAGISAVVVAAVMGWAMWSQ